MLPRRVGAAVMFGQQPSGLMRASRAASRHLLTRTSGHCTPTRPGSRWPWPRPRRSSRAVRPRVSAFSTFSALIRSWVAWSQLTYGTITLMISNCPPTLVRNFSATSSPYAWTSAPSEFSGASGSKLENTSFKAAPSSRRHEVVADVVEVAVVQEQSPAAGWMRQRTLLSTKAVELLPSLTVVAASRCGCRSESCLFISVTDCHGALTYVAGRHDRRRAEDQHEDRQAARHRGDLQGPGSAGFFDVARISRAITVTITSSIAANTCQALEASFFRAHAAIGPCVLFWRETSAESYDQLRCSTSKSTGRSGDGTPW